jgi:hypothetical protein
LSPLANWAGINYDGISMTKAGEVYDLRRGVSEEFSREYEEGVENFL